MPKKRKVISSYNSKTPAEETAIFEQNATPSRKKARTKAQQDSTPTPAKAVADISSGRTNMGNLESSQGDHIIANALIKSFLLSTDERYPFFKQTLLFQFINKFSLFS